MSDLLSQFSKNHYDNLASLVSGELSAGSCVQLSTDPDEVKGMRNTSSARSIRVGITAPEHIIEIDQEYEKHKLIRFGIIVGIVIVIKEFSNPAIIDNNYTRKDGLLIYMSKGRFDKNITVPDFTDKSKAEAWTKGNNVEAVYTEKSSGD